MLPDKTIKQGNTKHVTKSAPEITLDLLITVYIAIRLRHPCSGAVRDIWYRKLNSTDENLEQNSN
jgi:hypothetical protein